MGPFLSQGYNLNNLGNRQKDKATHRMHTKPQGHWPFRSVKKIFKGFLPYMGMVAILVALSIKAPHEIRL